jgi:lysophospholipase L1-like esterase
MARTITASPADLPAAWRGAAEWTESDGLWQPWRVSREELGNAVWDPIGLTEKAMVSNGARIVLSTDAEAFELDTVGDPERDSGIDVVCDGVLVANRVVPEGFATARVELPAGAKTLEIWLPHSARTQVGPVRLHGASFVEPGAPAPVNWIVYGSSISQCNTAPSPTRTWPALVSRELSWGLTALGMAGRCHIDPAVAKTIRDTPADVILLCLGINVYGKSVFDETALPAAITGFVQTVRTGHPRTPILLMTPIASESREQAVNEVGLTLSRVRELVAETGAALKAQGDNRIEVIDGLSVLSLAEQDLLGDGIHPTPEGYELMARRLEPRLRDARLMGTVHSG